MNRIMLAALLASGGCGIGGFGCTEIGCQGTVSIFLDRELSADAVVSVAYGASSWDCAAGGFGCEIAEEDGVPVLRFQVGMGEQPETVSVSIGEGGAEPADYEVPLSWGDPFYPNGQICDGEDGGCASGEGDLSLP